jgi:hypothetical protein
MIRDYPILREMEIEVGDLWWYTWVKASPTRQGRWVQAQAELAEMIQA